MKRIVCVVVLLPAIAEAAQWRTTSGGKTQSNLADFGTIGGGDSNVVTSQCDWGTISGGDRNSCSATTGTISGGSQNEITADYASIVGGYKNGVTANYASSLGGSQNNAAATYSLIAGGLQNNIASGATNAAICGGTLNDIAVNASNATVVAGNNNDVTSATADYGFIGGGTSNELASDGYAVIAGGSNNLANGEYSVIGGGVDNQITSAGDKGVVVGGEANTASAVYSTVIGGAFNSAETAASVAMGRYAKTTILGERAFAADEFAVAGDQQISEVMLNRTTTTATQVPLVIRSANQMNIAPGATWVFRVSVVARRTDTGSDSAGYTCDGVIKNSAGTTSLVGTATITTLAEDTGAAAWSVDCVADDTDDALMVKVTGAASSTIRWVGYARLTRVQS